MQLKMDIVFTNCGDRWDYPYQVKNLDNVYNLFRQSYNNADGRTVAKLLTTE